MPDIEYEKLGYSDELLKNSFKLLYQYNLCYMVGHIIICVGTFMAKAYWLSFANLISIAWFIFNSYTMKRTSIDKYDVAELRISVELILHQIVAFILVGPECGFQYILLESSCTIFTLNKNRKSKKLYIVKSIVTILIFVLMEILGNVINPVYEINEMVALIWSVTIVLYTFSITLYFTMKTYNDTATIIEDYKNKAINQEQKIQDIQREVISSMANIIESRDGSTGEHTKRTSELIGKMLDELKQYPEYSKKLTDEFVNNLKMAAPLHDIGKIKVPDAILLKPGKLDKDEFEEIKKHTTYGAEIINKSINNLEDKEYVNMVYNVANFHHERWDGKGYPENLSKEEIPLEARIMALVDVYDALTNKRCYKDEFTKEEALEIIREGIGTQFDPDLAKIFIGIME